MLLDGAEECKDDVEQVDSESEYELELIEQCNGETIEQSNGEIDSFQAITSNILDVEQINSIQPCENSTMTLDDADGYRDEVEPIDGVNKIGFEVLGDSNAEIATFQTEEINNLDVEQIDSIEPCDISTMNTDRNEGCKDDIEQVDEDPGLEIEMIEESKEEIGERAIMLSTNENNVIRKIDVNTAMIQEVLAFAQEFEGEFEFDFEGEFGWEEENDEEYFHVR